jgi:hypothetical protein
MGQQPHEQLWRLATAAVVARSLQVAAELGVADHVGDAPVSVKELAAACEADAGALDRVLLLLSAHGVFERKGDGFGHTDVSRLLCSDHPMSMRAFPRMMGMASFRDSFSQLEHSVRTGRPAFDLIDGEGVFAHLQRHPEEARIFGASMTARAAADIGALLDAYDFTRFATIADIGGGNGHLLRAVLDAVPDANGILFDLPSVVESIDIDTPRLVLHAGDFFADALPSADAYILMEVIHDWDDPQAAAILSAVSRAASPGATVLVIEAVLDDRHVDPVVHTLDVIMLAITGGRERTQAQLSQLLDSADLHVNSVHDTRGALRVVEAVAG